MLSDVTGMIGGETEIQKGDGSKIKAIGPEIGSVGRCGIQWYDGHR
jgi:hypothetical protein